MLALNNFVMDKKVLRNSIIYGFKRSFFPGRYQQKRNYVRQCLNYYDKIAAELPEVFVNRQAN
jgi:adenosine deaminase